eukprot:TRINITY_DN722_c0_g2_i3.p1 TRINITY_DN722_c0_g2~~TRINITY_DN722_c0_g2_i3.p1  ORF type:complete len:418 (+),score=199.29 TRINITY_DN722_c0_g2_i3:253-1506(+)
MNAEEKDVLFAELNNVVTLLNQEKQFHFQTGQQLLELQHEHQQTRQLLDEAQRQLVKKAAGARSTPPAGQPTDHQQQQAQQLEALTARNEQLEQQLQQLQQQLVMVGSQQQQAASTTDQQPTQQQPDADQQQQQQQRDVLRIAELESLLRQRDEAAASGAASAASVEAKLHRTQKQLELLQKSAQDDARKHLQTAQQLKQLRAQQQQQPPAPDPEQLEAQARQLADAIVSRHRHDSEQQLGALSSELDEARRCAAQHAEQQQASQQALASAHAQVDLLQRELHAQRDQAVAELDAERARISELQRLAELQRANDGAQQEAIDEEQRRALDGARADLEALRTRLAAADAEADVARAALSEQQQASGDKHAELQRLLAERVDGQAELRTKLDAAHAELADKSRQLDALLHDRVRASAAP